MEEKQPSEIETFCTMKFKQFRFVLVRGCSSIVCHFKFNLFFLSREFHHSFFLQDLYRLSFCSGSISLEFLHTETFGFYFNGILGDSLPMNYAGSGTISQGKYQML